MSFAIEVSRVSCCIARGVNKIKTIFALIFKLALKILFKLAMTIEIIKFTVE